MQKIRIGLLIAGVKGLNFLKSFPQGHEICFVASYPSKGLQCQPVDEIRSICQANSYPYFDSKFLSLELLNNADIIFVAGWQYLFNYPIEKMVVLHDALLPKYRGFAPTVNALICGEQSLGVTAFKPVDKIDAGPILDQIKIDITYPIKIKQVYQQLGECYALCAANVIDLYRHGQFTGQSQNESEASYSIWRDESDLFINWNQDSYTIMRFIDALGWPYPGARTTYKGNTIIISDVEVIPPKDFALIHPGKIWELNTNQPDIICKNGILRILAAQHLHGKPVLFDKLREQLGTSLSSTPISVHNQIN